jgi:hypothetical protein
VACARKGIAQLKECSARLTLLDECFAKVHAYG